MAQAQLGVMDWGIGGLTVVQALRRAGCTANVVYLSDAGYPPYGKVARPVLTARLAEVAAWMGRRGVQQVLVACNAASTALPQDVWTVELPEGGRVALHSIIPAALHSVQQARPFRALGVIGGEGTIGSGLYVQRLRELGIQAHAAVAQPLSALVEAGDLDGEATRAAVAAILSRLPADLDALLLACTHYPALAGVFAHLAPGVRLIDPAVAMAQGQWPSGQSRLQFWTTGSAQQSMRSAHLAFGLVLQDAGQVPLDLGN